MTAQDAFADPRALRDAFGCFMTGVTVVTCLQDDETPLGFTANSFSSVSMDPPLLLVSIANKSANLSSFAEGAGFAINILAEDQTAISNKFARPSDDRFADVYWRRGPVGSPLISDVTAWFDCTLERAIEMGDHTILVGRIGAFEASAKPGLGYHRGAYFTPAETAGQMPTGPDVILSAIVEYDGQVLLVDDGRSGEMVPMTRVGKQGVQSALEALLVEYGVSAEAGSVYSVYEDTTRGTQNLALRCAATSDVATKGAFVSLDQASVADVSDPALRHMLERLSSETKSGNYGVYFGNFKQGRVERAGGK